ncbi:hypothetical protein ACHAWU_009737 [Discostella pseudostelligera]|uniref:BspA family leucine-rich repeat surface protein n=1 Tax=Discostella pseudostelligera TaxID=259834 RepID=A0ABD3M6B4_9STRA
MLIKIAPMMGIIVRWDNSIWLADEQLFWCVTNITGMKELFYYGQSTFHEDISDWDVSSSVTTMSVATLSDWDVSSVADIMSNMFYGAAVFHDNLSSCWDVSSVIDKSHMFDGAEKFNGDFSGWDASSVTDMQNMFCDAFTFDGNVSDWDVSLCLT